MAVKKTIEIDVRTEDSVQDVNKLTHSINKTDQQTEATKKTTDSLTNSLDRMTGGAITGFKGIVSGAKNGVIAMRSLKVAIAATGIGLLVLAVASLVTYFTQTQRGADLVKKAFDAVGATVSVLVDRVSVFGEGLALIFSGKYREGAKLLNESFQSVGAEIEYETKAAWELQDALQAIEDKEIELIQVNAKRRASIEKLRLDAEDATKTEEERAAALQESIRIQNELTDDEIAIAKERARISQAQTDLGESTREELRANEEIQARVVELEAQRDRRLKTVQTRLNSLTGATKEAGDATGDYAKKQREATEAEEKRLEKIEELEQKYVERKRELEAKTEEEKLELDRSKAEAELERLVGTETEKKEAQLALNAFYDEKERELQEAKLAQQKADEEEYLRRKEVIKNQEIEYNRQKAEAERRIEVEKNNAIVDLAGQTAGIVANILGRNSKLGKAAGIAQTLINTYQGISEVWKTPSALPEPAATIARIASTATVGASGFAAVKNIIGVKLPSFPGAGGGSESGGNAPRSSTPPTPSFNIVGNSQANQLGDALNRQDSPIKAFVVSRNMTSQQELDRNIKQTASVG